ncbi:hypothetical protein G6O67_005290 [Ophiocordyceps sinensis]|uniref:NmrA-like domain-containing protein n=1 Tax=Ophiocordyceps sinensis TaxID=72228 RepID=A0A8H4PR84_9HYPO|nr:hypothetical protein G6O67_005290 [Ophiocordyceps sinensis]
MAAPLPSHILIIGATGNIGKYITNSVLQAKPSFPKITVLTSAATASAKHELLNGWKASGVSIIIGDVTNSADIANAYRSVDTVISCVGRGVLDQQQEFIRLAEESESVQWFFPSEYGTDIEHNSRSPNEKPHQMKLAVRKYVREHTSRLKVTYVVVGPYFEMWVGMGRFGHKLGGFDIKNKEAAVIADGQGQIGFTTMPDTGKAVVAALRHPEASFNKALKVASFVATPNQVLAECEKQTGAKFTVRHIPLAEVEAFEDQMYKEQNPFAAVSALRRIWATGGTLYGKWDNQSIGLDSSNLESLEVAVQRHVRGETS